MSSQTLIYLTLRYTPFQTRKVRIVMDWSVMDSKARKVQVKGRISKIYEPKSAHVPPLSNYYTATLYPVKGRVFYLKFKIESELKKQAITENELVIVEADLRLIDGKQILTNVRRVRKKEL